MSNTLVIPQGFAKPAIFQNKKIEGNLAKGVHTGFAVIGYKGRNWSVRYRGEETHLCNANGDPMASINVVILDSAPNVSKVYYQGPWVEGSTEAPDCYSVNGVVPENDSKQKQSNTCAACPHNVWGSRINEATGKKGKACMDSKRAAVVPFDDINNEIYGGPMLLRIPAASMANAANYANQLSAMGYDTYMVGTKVNFKVGESYPLMEFSVVPRPMSDEQAELVEVMRKSPLIPQILRGGGEYSQMPPQEPTTQATGPSPSPSPVGTVQQPKVTPTPVEADAEPKTAPVQGAGTNGAGNGAEKVVSGFGGGAPAPAKIEAKATGRGRLAKKTEAAAPKVEPTKPAAMGVEEDLDFDALLKQDFADLGIEN